MNAFAIGSFTVSLDTPPLIIAEIGNNHDANFDQALQMIDVAAAHGADAVKFQTYRADKLVTPEHELYSFFSKFALPLDWHEPLKQKAEAAGLLFLSTPFDYESATFLNSLGVPALKIASSDLTNTPFIRLCASFGKPLLISTGMGSLEETGLAIEAAHSERCYDLALLHCVSVYPTPADQVHLPAITQLAQRFGLLTGFSDHSLSPVIPAAAVALGARIIEKHFTISRNLEGPDHAVALEPEEFRIMATGCRETWEAMHGDKEITDALRSVRKASLRGLYAAADLEPGSIISDADVAVLRPPADLTVEDLADVLGKQVIKKIAAGEPLRKSDFADKAK